MASNVKKRLYSIRLAARKILFVPKTRLLNSYHMMMVWIDYLKTCVQVRELARTKTNSPECKEVLLLSLVNTAMFAKFDGILAKAFELRNYKCTILCYKSQFVSTYMKAFGLRSNVVFWEDIAEKYSPLQSDIDNIMERLIPNKLTAQQIKALSFHEVAIGRHALSMTLRKLFLGHPDLSDPIVWGIFVDQFRLDLQAVLIMERWLSDYTPTTMLMRDPGYVPNGAIYETALLRGVDTIEYALGQKSGTLVFKRFTPQERWIRYLSISSSTWEEIRRNPWTLEQEEILQKEFEGRYQPQAGFDIRFIQHGKKLKSADEIYRELALDPSKKTAVVFSHVAFDAAFFSGQDIFEDLEEWFIETARAAYENSSLNWILKLHPANLAKVGFAKGFEEPELAKLRELGPLPNHVKILRANTEINTKSLYTISDYGLTVRGTIGFELPCLGIPTLTAGNGYYTGYGFTIDSNSRCEYLERLAHLQDIPSLTDEQIILAKKHAYCLFIQRQLPVADLLTFKFVPTRKNHVLSQNADIQIRKVDELMHTDSLVALTDWITKTKTPDLIYPPKN